MGIGISYCRLSGQEMTLTDLRRVDLGQMGVVVLELVGCRCFVMGSDTMRSRAWYVSTAKTFWEVPAWATIVLTLTTCRSSPDLRLESQRNGHLASIWEYIVTAEKEFPVLLAYLHHGIDSANGQDLPFVAEEGLRL